MIWALVFLSALVPKPSDAFALSSLGGSWGDASVGIDVETDYYGDGYSGQYGTEFFRGNRFGRRGWPFDRYAFSETVDFADSGTTEVITRRPEVIARRPQIIRPEIITRRPEIITQSPPIITRQPEVVVRTPEIITQQPEIILRSPGRITRQPEVILRSPEIITEQPGFVTRSPEVIRREPEVVLYDQPRTVRDYSFGDTEIVSVRPRVNYSPRRRAVENIYINDYTPSYGGLLTAGLGSGRGSSFYFK